TGARHAAAVGIAGTVGITLRRVDYALLPGSGCAGAVEGRMRAVTGIRPEVNQPGGIALGRERQLSAIRVSRRRSTDGPPAAEVETAEAELIDLLVRPVPHLTSERSRGRRSPGTHSREGVRATVRELCPRCAGYSVFRAAVLQVAVLVET